MKVKELYSQVAALGFEDSLESAARNRFYFAANRALLQIAAVRPVIKHLILKHRPLTNLIENKGEVNVDGEAVFETSGAKAYYFEFEGTGTAYVEYYNGNEWQSCTDTIVLSISQNKSRKGIIKPEGNFTRGAVRLRFMSNGYILRVKNISLYGAIYGDSADLIPDNEEYSRYDVSSLVDDFMSLHTPLIRDDGSFVRLGEGYDVENNRVILIPRENAGNYRVLYKHKPNAISLKWDPQNNDDDIDLDEDLVALMPLLVASYLWLDEEPEKAQYYLSLYREGASYIKNEAHNLAPTSIITNGWA